MNSLRRYVTVLAMTVIAGSLFAACQAAPRQRPVEMGPVDKGPGSLGAVRKQCEGTWVSLETHPETGPAVLAKATGQLTYDQYGNLTVKGIVEGSGGGSAPDASRYLMLKGRCVLAALVVLASPVVSLAQKAQETAQKVVIDYDKKTDLTKYKTFTWGTGYKALNPVADKAIIAAVEKQLAANGMTKATSSTGDITVRYHSVERADVDLSTFDQKAPDPGAQRKMAETFRVGTLVVDLVDPASQKRLWRGRVEGAISHDPATFEQQVDAAVARLFEKFPVGKPLR